MQLDDRAGVFARYTARMTRSSELETHYGGGYEQRRLAAGAGRLEWLRTMEIIERFAPAPPAMVLDVGGGAGAYALPLARRGYAVELIDAVELHISQALRAAGEQPEHPLVAATVGDARQLPNPDASVDLVLLLGPLYHLTEAADRLSALREARRVLRPGGVLLAAGISRFASTCDGLRHRYLKDPDFEAIVERDLAEGQHRNPRDEPGWFTTTYFHHPDELGQELVSADLELKALLGVEGPAWLMAELDRWLADDPATLLRALRRVEAEPSLLGASAHIIAVGRRPTSRPN
jgi:ubiquinone/menaquinone biosynthesis C-methylase UbiE